MRCSVRNKKVFGDSKKTGQSKCFPKAIVFNVPLLGLLMILSVSVSSLLTLVDSNFLLLEIIGNVAMFTGFFLCLFIVVGGCYYLYKIMNGKCYYCHKKIENRTKKAMIFLLTPP